MKKTLILIFGLSVYMLFGQSYTDTFTSLPPLFFASTDFADFDNDGDQDIAIMGVDADFADQAFIYENVNGQFVLYSDNLSAVHMGAVKWVDFDNDGDYDLFIAGQNYGMIPSATLYKNSDGVFTPTMSGIPTGFWNGAGWGDYDNDGDMDLAYSWYIDNVAYSGIFRNDGGSFTDIEASLTALMAGSMEWADYDNDGDLDLLQAGTLDDFSQSMVKVYQNNNGIFNEKNFSFMDIAWYNNALWNDVDNDGDPDIVFVGDQGSNYPFVIYINQPNGFELYNTGIMGVRGSNGNMNLVGEDLDNDGDVDFVNTGDDPSYNKATKIFINNLGSFSELDHNIPGFGSSTLDVSDIDNDGDVDIVLFGYDDNSSADVGLYKNNAGSNTYSSNVGPSIPSGLNYEVNEGVLRLYWENSTDDHTPEASLNYNVYLGTEPGMGDIVSCQSLMNTEDDMFGLHFVPMMGNAQYNLEYTITTLPDGQYYWSVQALDQSGFASGFAEEQVIELGSSTSLNELNDDLTIYPNPCHQILNIETNQNDWNNYRILDMYGKVVEEGKLNKSDALRVDHLSNGIYMLELDHLKVPYKIQVQH